VPKRKTTKLSARLGNNLASARKDVGLTQDQLAERLGVDTETISRFERGVTTPSLATLEELAQKVGLTMAVLLDEDTPAPPDDLRVIATQMAGLKRRERVFLMELIKLYCQQHE
jgi:transcriptional regulator with XRE-family HTH domain